MARAYSIARTALSEAAAGLLDLPLGDNATVALR